MARELIGSPVDEDDELTLSELTRLCGVSAEWVYLLVDEGIIEPVGGHSNQWRFQRLSVLRVRRVQRLERDLGVNLAGAALALDLADEIEQLKTRLRRFEEHF